MHLAAVAEGIYHDRKPACAGGPWHGRLVLHPDLPGHGATAERQVAVRVARRCGADGATPCGGVGDNDRLIAVLVDEQSEGVEDVAAADAPDGADLVARAPVVEEPRVRVGDARALRVAERDATAVGVAARGRTDGDVRALDVYVPRDLAAGERKVVMGVARRRSPYVRRGDAEAVPPRLLVRHGDRRVAVLVEVQGEGVVLVGSPDLAGRIHLHALLACVEETGVYHAEGYAVRAEEPVGAVAVCGRADGASTRDVVALRDELMPRDLRVSSESYRPAVRVEPQRRGGVPVGLGQDLVAVELKVRLPRRAADDERGAVVCRAAGVGGLGEDHGLARRDAVEVPVRVRLQVEPRLVLGAAALAERAYPELRHAAFEAVDLDLPQALAVLVLEPHDAADLV